MSIIAPNFDWEFIYISESSDENEHFSLNPTCVALSQFQRDL